MFGFVHAILAQAPQAPPLQPLPHPELPDPTLVKLGPEWWVYAAAGALVLILLALVIWLLLRPAKAKAPPMKKPWNDAMNRLRDILVKSTQQPPTQTAADVSETLRVYFFERYKIPAPFRTTQELFVKEGIPATSLKLQKNAAPAEPWDQVAFAVKEGIPATSQKLQKYAALADLWDQLAFAPVPSNHGEATALVQKAISHLEEDRT